MAAPQILSKGTGRGNAWEPGAWLLKVPSPSGGVLGRGRPGDWQAICVDFDLAAQGESLEDLRRELADAIETYLEYVADLPQDEQARFLNRKSQGALGLRLRLVFLHRTFGLFNSLKFRVSNSRFSRAGFVVNAAL